MKADKKKLLRCKPEGIPEAFKERGYFLIWNQRAREGNGQPVAMEGFGNSVSRPQDWKPFRYVLPILQRGPRFYPFIVLTDDLGITCFDVDKKPRKEGESVEEFKARHERAENAFRELVALFPGAYVERSKSGQGYHVFVRGSFKGANIGSGGASGKWADVEVYCRSRGIAMTGQPVKGIPPLFGELDSSAEIQALVDEMRPPKKSHRDDNFAEGQILEDHARFVLAQVAGKVGRPERADWVKIASAAADGVGGDLAVELMDEFFPDEERDAHEKLLRSLTTFAPWQTLRAFGVNPDPPETYFPEVPSSSPKEGGMGSGYDFEAIWERTRFDPDNEPEEEEPVLSFKGRPACSRGSLAVLQGQPKTGKSGVISAIGGAVIAAMYETKEELVGDTLGFVAHFEPDSDCTLEPSFLHLDTEQSKTHHYASVRRMEKRAAAKTPSGFYSHRLTEVDLAHRCRFLRDFLDKMRSEGQPPALVILDGVADFCEDVNDAKEANALVEELHRLAGVYDCVILGVIHENPGTDIGKTRGHLGSQLARKAETTFKVRKEGKVTTLFVHLSRVMDVPEDEGLAFSWCELEEMHTTVGEAKDVREQAKLQQAIGELEKVFGKDRPALAPAELRQAIVETLNLSEGTAKNRITNWKRLGLIEMRDHAYVICDMDMNLEDGGPE